MPNDPLFTQQWHLQNTGQQAGTAGEDARLTTAWDSVRGTGVVIGMVDDGLQYRFFLGNPAQTRFINLIYFPVMST